MNNRRLSDAQISAALRAHLPAQARAGLPGRVMGAVDVTSQQRPLPSFLGALSDADPIGARRSLLIAAALLLAVALAGAAAVGAWQLIRRDTVPKLNLTPPADVPAFVLSSYDRMPQMPPVAITTLENGSVKGRMYVDRSGAIRIEHYPTLNAAAPDTYEVRNGTSIGQLTIVGSTKEWIRQDGAMTEDPRVFLLAAMLGGGAVNQPGCGVTRNQGEVGDGTAASGWTYVGTDYVVGRPTFHVTCGGGDLWIDVETRLILRSRGPAQNVTFLPVDGAPVPSSPGAVETIEVTAIDFGDQPADLFKIAPPPGVALMNSDAYQCQINPISCATPEPTPPPYTPPPGAIQGPLPSLPPSRVSNGWIAYSTDGQTPGATDDTNGSDIYLVREGGEPRLIAGREGGTTRNVCPAFSPDGTRLAFGVTGPQGRAVVVLGVDATGVINHPLHITVPGSGTAVCVRWSSDGQRLGYVDRGMVVIRGLDGSSPVSVAGDPSAKDFGRMNEPLLSPSGAWAVRVSFNESGCQMVVARPDGAAAHVWALGYCPYAIAAWSPDGEQVLLMEDVSGHDFTMHAIGVDSLANVTVVSTVRTNGARSWPGWGDVSWQPVYP
jgi:WD40-like Beta Propeller Repeat